MSALIPDINTTPTNTQRGRSLSHNGLPITYYLNVNSRVAHNVRNAFHNEPNNLRRINPPPTLFDVGPALRLTNELRSITGG